MPSGPNVVAIHRKSKKKRLQRILTDLRALKLLRGCADCGYEANADAMEFDHVRGAKASEVAKLANRSYVLLIEEIAKCDVVCANCHSIRTASRRREAA